jgi:hypothetical protein
LEYFENKNIWNFSKRGAIIIHQKFGSENGGMHKLRKEGKGQETENRLNALWNAQKLNQTL